MFPHPHSEPGQKSNCPPNPNEYKTLCGIKIPIYILLQSKKSYFFFFWISKKNKNPTLTSAMRIDRVSASHEPLDAGR